MFLRKWSNPQKKGHPALVGRPTILDGDRDSFSWLLKVDGMNIRKWRPFRKLFMVSSNTENLTDEIIPAATRKPKGTSVGFTRKTTQKRKVGKDKLSETLTEEKRKIVNLASEKSASYWLNGLPLTNYGFNLEKSDLQDGLHLRYGNEPRKLLKTCQCGRDFTISYALHCPKGGYTQLRHNEIRNTFTLCMDDLCATMSKLSLFFDRCLAKTSQSQKNKFA